MKKLLITGIFFLAAYLSFGQTSQERANMERERQEIQKELKEIQSTYSKVRGQTKATMGQLTVLQRKMDIQDRYIGNINKEIHIINDDIYLSSLEINRLQKQLDTLKAEYAKSVMYAYKNNSSYDYLNFIFSATSFNDALKRVSYLKSYRNYRQQQVATIRETQKLIQDRKQQLLGKQNQKQGALKNQQEQLSELEDQKKEKAQVVNKLKSQESELKKQIAAKTKRDRQLRSQIAAMIRREIEDARRKAALEERARNNSSTAAATPNANAGSTRAAPKGGYLNLNATDVALNANFEKNRGNLPWPVDNGYVSVPFGTSKVGGVSIENPGITILTPSAGTPVKAVFNGEVTAVSNTGDGLVVMIRHGKYFSIYSNLASASVSKGQQITRGEVIGRTNQAEEGEGGQLDFILMNEYKNVNPEPWLHRH